jgi:CSLREA domain-containing protein
VSTMMPGTAPGTTIDKTRWIHKRARALTFFALALLVALCIGVLFEAKPAHAKTFTVNSTSDASDDVLNGICDTDPRITRTVCTLRAAIQEANNTLHNSGDDFIQFRIPYPEPNCNDTTRVCTISPASGLPPVTDQVTIDGYTQRACLNDFSAPCSKPNSSAVGTNAVLLIQLNGSNAANFETGLAIEAPNSVVKGLVINRFQVGLKMGNTGGNRIEGNFIGTNAAGTADLGNDGSGVDFFAFNSTLGGTSRAARNLISGNGQRGVAIFANAQMHGNLIGTDRTGTQDLGNDWSGVELFSSGGATVGGDTAASANVIAFNGESGVEVGDSAFAAGNAIQRNSIFSNEGLGIDLGDDGRTPNDADNPSTAQPDPDSDTGPNNLQNFPVITSALTGGGATAIQARLNSTPSTTFVVRYFANPSTDNEGKRYLGSKSVDTDSSGNASFSSVITPGVRLGQKITATATDPTGNTSEFSAPQEVETGTAS